MEHRKKVVVVGAGFAGIQFVSNLDENLFDILLIDKINHHQFQPLFYQVATSQIEPSSISFPIRNIFKRKKNIKIRIAEFQSVIHEEKKITTSIGEFSYDILVLALGCSTNFFGNKNLSTHSLTLKSTYDAITIRNHILTIFESAISANEDEKQSLLNLVIVGGGPTGVELAGAFAEIKNFILPKDYPDIDFSNFNITIVEGSKNLLNNMSNKAKTASAQYLKKMGVTIITETIVKDFDGKTLTFNNGNQIKTKSVIWAAGIIGNSIPGIPPSSVMPGNRIKVNRTNKVEGIEDVYVIGDVALMTTDTYPKGHPQVANVAINQGKNLAKNLKRSLKNKKLKDYEYLNLGCMATIGRNKAVVDFPFMQFKGYMAWLIWMFLHLMLILSVRNKLIIFINWAWAYISKDSSLRLIMNGNSRKQL